LDVPAVGNKRAGNAAVTKPIERLIAEGNEDCRRARVVRVPGPVRPVKEDPVCQKQNA